MGKHKAKHKRRGRPHLDEAVREPSGRVSRRVVSRIARSEETERAALATAVETRIRREAEQTGEVLDFKAARDPRRGTVLGLLLLDGEINQSQYEAGTRYAETKWAYHALTGVPFPTAKAQDLFRSRGGVEALTDRAIANARGAANAYLICKGWMLSIGCVPMRGALSAVNAVCCEDEETARFWPATAPHMVRLLRRGLHALATGYGI